MPHDPSDIAGCKIGISEMYIVDVIHGPVQSYGGASVVPDYTFGSSGCTRSIKNVEIVCAFHLLGWDVFELQRFETELFPVWAAFDAKIGTLADEDRCLVLGEDQGLVEDLDIVDLFVRLQTDAGCHYGSGC